MLLRRNVWWAPIVFDRTFASRAIIQGYRGMGPGNALCLQASCRCARSSSTWRRSSRSECWYRHLEVLDARRGMSRKANCQDNATAESFSGHFKTEFFYRSNFKTMPEVRTRLDEYIDWYNNEQVRCDLGGLPPVEHREQYQAMQT